MSRYSDEERFRIIDSARETLRRLDEEDRQRVLLDQLAQRAVDRLDDAGSWSVRRSILDPVPSTAMDRWRAEAAEQDERRRRVREADAEHQRREMERRTMASEDWNAWLRAGVDAAREEQPFTDRQIDVLGMFIAEERERMRKEIQQAVGELRAEIAVQKSVEREAREGEIIDLPRELWKRRDVA
jgi:hypothetical protein